MSSSSEAQRFATTRRSLQLVATHVLARARHRATGRFGLRITPGGFATPEFGPNHERIRVSGTLLVVESGQASATSSRAIALDGHSLLELAAFAGVNLREEFSVGEDTPPLGDVAALLPVNEEDASVLACWFSWVAEALDRVVADLPQWATPTMTQLWPEHFDLALDAAFDEVAPGERRVNLGGSPGDDFVSEPYVYVGPWTPDRPGDAVFWTAPFGSALPRSTVLATALRAGGSPVDEITRHLRTGFDLLAGDARR